MSSGSKLIFSQQQLAGAPVLVFGASDVAPVTPAAPKDRRALVFRELVTDVADIGALVFKADETGELPPVAITDINLRATGQITGLRGCITLRSSAVVQATGTLSGLRGHITVRIAPVLRGTGCITGLRGFVAVQYDINTARTVVKQGHASWQDADRQGVASVVGYGNATTTSTGPRARWKSALPLATQTHTTWQRTALLRRGLFSVWQEAQPMSTALLQCWQSAIALQAAILTRYSDTIRMSSELLTSHLQAAYRDRQAGFFSDWQDATSIASGVWQHLVNAHDLLRAMRLQHQDAAKVHPGKSQHLPPPGLTPRCYVPAPRLLFNASWSKSTALVFSCECKAAGPLARVVVPTSRAYVTINNIILRRVDGDIPIPAYAFSMSLDYQSWTWSWSASIALASLPLITPGSDGLPIEIEAVINGVPYRLACEGFSSQKQFASGRIGVKGRGLAAVLDAPYAPVLNFASADSRSAQQLMQGALTINGVSIGWELDWGLTDWLVPGNTWTHQGAYISAITAIAQAAGGYVQPHNTAKTLRILPSYPTAPWAWADVTPGVELPSAVVTVEGIDWTRKPDYNRVFVSGMSNGVLGQVTRAGTAGDSVAPMITDALITHADAARQRGLSVLSDTGAQERINLTLPVLAETGLITPGQFVRYVDAGTTRIGLVRGTNLTWALPKMRQTLSIETHV